MNPIWQNAYVCIAIFRGEDLECNNAFLGVTDGHNNMQNKTTTTSSQAIRKEVWVLLGDYFINKKTG